MLPIHQGLIDTYFAIPLIQIARSFVMEPFSIVSTQTSSSVLPNNINFSFPENKINIHDT